MILFYGILVLSGIWAEEKILYLSSIRMKVIFLVIPFCFLVLPRWSVLQWRWFSLALIIAVALSTICVAFNYHLHHPQILANISLGQPIPVPFKDHIRYSILLCFCFILSLFQLDTYRKEQKMFPCILWCMAVFVLFFYIQFLAVKTGMLLSILIIVIFVGVKIAEKRQYLKGVLSLCFIALAIFLALEYLPTVKNKLSYFSWDIAQYKERNFQNYSDSERIVSMLKGIEVIEHHLFLGVGEGQLVTHISAIENAPAKLPHNQFIVVWAQNGLLGLASFLGIFILSYYYAYRAGNWLAGAYTTAMLAANMLEPMLETQLGLTLFCIPLLLLHSVELPKKS